MNMTLRLSLRILFLTIICMAAFSAQAAGAGARLDGVGDFTDTPQPSDLEKMRQFLLSNPSEAELEAAVLESASFLTRADDDTSDAAKLGALFKRLKDAAKNEEELDSQKAQLQQARKQVLALQGAGGAKDASADLKTELERVQSQYRFAQGAVGALALFIVIDKVALPLAKKCRKRFQKTRSPE